MREKGEMRNVYCRGERLGLSLCAVPLPRRMWGSFDLWTEQRLRNNEGICEWDCDVSTETDKD